MKTWKNWTLVAIIAFWGIIVCFTACPPDGNGTEQTHTHAWNEGTITVQPTCSAKGLKTFTCTIDSSHIRAQEIDIDPNAHNWGTWTQTTAPTFTTYGEETRTCIYDSSHKETRTFDDPLPITTSDNWNVALDQIRNGGNGVSAQNPKTYTLIINGNIIIPGCTGDSYTETTFGSTEYITVTLKGNGTLGINPEGDENRGFLIFLFYYYQTLIIDSENLTLQGRSNNSRSIIFVGRRGRLELKNGNIKGNTLYSGITLTGGTFIMTGGTISGNTNVQRGGGVYFDGNDPNTFTMTGGTITGNSAVWGGGVYIGTHYAERPQTFTKTGGIIYGNDSSTVEKNTATNGNTNGHAVIWSISGSTYFRDTTLGLDNNISTDIPDTNWTLLE
jgi:hypothetical protein